MNGLKTALDLAMALPENWQAPSAQTWAAFSGWVMSVFDQFYNWLNTTDVFLDNPNFEGGTASGQRYSDEGMGIVSTFAAALNNLMGGLSAAMNMALAMPGTWPKLGADDWEPFFTWVQDTFDTFSSYIEENFPTTESEAYDFGPVQTFGNAMNALFGGLSSAMDVLTNLITFVAPTDQRITDFMDAVKLTVTKIKTYAETQLTEAQATAVKTFGEALSTLTGGLSDALDLFKKLADTDSSIYTESDQFKDRVGLLLESISNTISAFKTYVIDKAGTEWIPAAQQMYNSLSNTFDIMRSGLDLFTDLSNATLPGNPALAGFYQSGVNLGLSLGRGLLDQQNYLSQAGWEAGQALLQAMKDALGIHSPSSQAIAVADNVAGTLQDRFRASMPALQDIGKELGAAITPDIPQMPEIAISGPPVIGIIRHEVVVTSPDGSMSTLTEEQLSQMLTDIVRTGV